MRNDLGKTSGRSQLWARTSAQARKFALAWLCREAQDSLSIQLTRDLLHNFGFVARGNRFRGRLAFPLA
jgi:hypothetical protein